MKQGAYILHHGTDRDFDYPSIERSSRYSDFGKCFYTTYDRQLAEEWAKTKSIYPKVLHYCINLKNAHTGNDWKIKKFEADEEWARFVYANRRNPSYIRPDYDIIIGPIADNRLAEIFADMEEKHLSFDYITQKIKYEKFDRTPLQVCFCSDRALKLLSKVTL